MSMALKMGWPKQLPKMAAGLPDQQHRDGHRLVLEPAQTPSHRHRANAKRARAATTELGLKLASSGFLRSQRYKVYELGLVNLEDLMAPDDG